MHQNSEIYFLGLYVCHFTHRQKQNRRLGIEESDDKKVWIDYTEKTDGEQLSRLCVQRKVSIKSKCMEALRASIRGELERGEGVEFSVEMEKRRAQRWRFPSGLPSGCDDRLLQLKQEMKRVAERVITNLRWRLDLHGPGKPFSTSDFLWSEDAISWNQVPTEIHAFPGVRRDIMVDQLDKSIVTTALSEERLEPLAHSLLRDAWSQLRRDFKSALIQGVTALEVGVKHAVVKLLPDAEYLMLEMPSPPVANLLSEFIPQLIRTFRPILPELDADTIKLVRNMVHQRNLLVHKGELTVDEVKTCEYLEIIHDLLYYLDYLSGGDWALSLTSREFKEWIRKFSADVELIDPLSHAYSKEGRPSRSSER